MKKMKLYANLAEVIKISFKSIAYKILSVFHGLISCSRSTHEPSLCCVTQILLLFNEVSMAGKRDFM